jgi:hypothetical protein
MSETDEFTYAPKDYTITRNIPYQIRWKIMHMKLMLYDLKELKDKYGIESAMVLYEVVREDINDYLKEVAKLLYSKKKKVMEMIK